MKKLFLLTASIIAFALIANAQNLTVEYDVNDTIDSNVTWAYDTIFMDASLYILDDVTLTINPGATIIFNDHYGFYVEGSILSLGTETDSITFTVADTTGFSLDYGHTGWDGFEFDNDNGNMDDNAPSRFAFCNFLYSNRSSDGGVFYANYYDNFEITHSTFESNYSNNYGGAIQLHYCSGGVIDHCNFINNECRNRGGAIDLYDCTGTILISYNNFENNYAGGEGGAIKAGGYQTAIIANNTFIGNSSEDTGGAIMSSGYSNNIIVGNLFKNNFSEQAGGAIKVAYYSNSTIANNTIIDNEALYGGGGIHCGYYSGVLTLKNNIIYNNTDSTSTSGNLFLYFGDGRTANVTNNIIGGGFDDICLNYSTFEGIYENNIDEDPLFIDYDNGDYTIDCSSPCLNAGEILPVLPDFDIFGTPRIIGSSVDIGFSEVVSAANIISHPENQTSCANSTTTMTVSADLATAYQWEVSSDFGENWEAIEDDAIYTGSTSASLSILPDISLNGNKFRCLITGPCEDALSMEAFLLVNALPNVNLGPDLSITSKESITLDAGIFTEYLWSTDETTQTIDVDGADLVSGDFTYEVTVTDVNGCTDSDDIQISVQDVSAIGDDELQAVSIYPNPSNGIININSPINSEIEIIDISGKIIVCKNTDSEKENSFDLSEFDAGIYYIKITNNNESIIKKVVIK